MSKIKSNHYSELWIKYDSVKVGLFYGKGSSTFQAEIFLFGDVKSPKEFLNISLMRTFIYKVFNIFKASKNHLSGLILFAPRLMSKVKKVYC